MAMPSPAGLFGVLVLMDAMPMAHGAPHCPEIAFQKPASERARISVDQIDGEFVATPPQAPRELPSVPNLCLALFSEDGGKRLAVGSTNPRGRFALTSPGPRNYVLIAATQSHGSVGIPLNVAAIDRGAAAQRGLLVHLRQKGKRVSAVTAVIGNLPLRRELLGMQKSDQDVRNEAIRGGFTHMSAAVMLRMYLTDSKNDSRIREIVRQYGWPGPDLVGPDGAGAAWLIVQHAPYELQKQMFPLVEAGYRAGTIRGGDYALLLDRILVREDRPQVYGSQAKPFGPNGEVVLEPIEDEAHVDQRRATEGLPPLAEYREMLKKLYFPPK